MTDRQSARQKARSNGRYEVMNICEDCGAHVGTDYYSDPDCDKTGKGLVLCKKCAEK